MGASAKSVVHVVDDEKVFRMTIARLLQSAGYETRTYASAGEFALAGSEDVGGCVLLDLQMPGMSGLELQACLVRAGFSLPIIFMSGHGDIATSVRAMKAGAADFLTKPVSRANLLVAVQAALARHTAALRRRARLEHWRAALRSLTPREQAVFERVTAGQPNKQIASETGIAERTVKAYRAHVMEKMGAGSLAELVHIADELQRPKPGRIAR